MDPHTDQPSDSSGYQLPQVRDDYTPATFGNSTSEQSAAADLIRAKIAGLFVEEPTVVNEEREITAEQRFHLPLSRHQQYLESLKRSGMSGQQLEAAWHSYYNKLDDDGKLEVWAEYNAKSTLTKSQNDEPAKTLEQKAVVDQVAATPPVAIVDYSALQHHALPEPTKKTKLKSDKKRKKHDDNEPSTIGFRDHPKYKTLARHMRSIVFAVSVGVLFLFVMNNELVIGRVKSYLSPGTAVAGPIIQDATDVKVGPESRIIIPKLNVDLPIIIENYDVTKESEFQKRLELGVVQIPGTALPGQNGNVVIVGHSSSNIFGPEKYKWAFVLLGKLDNGDTFQINYKGQRYIYAVYGKKVVKPADISVIYGPTPQPFTTSLITCDPPGTAYNRLVIQANQIFPVPNLSTPKVASSTETNVTTVPGNSISLTQRIKDWLFH